jgi:50S ribosome-binding GTPase
MRTSTVIASSTIASNTTIKALSCYISSSSSSSRTTKKLTAVPLGSSRDYFGLFPISKTTTTASDGGLDCIASNYSRSFHSNTASPSPHQSKHNGHRSNATAGRIALVQQTPNAKKKKTPTVQLCLGCGAEVRNSKDANAISDESTSRALLTGTDTVLAGQSKKMAKQARFVDAVTPNSNRGGGPLSRTKFYCQRCVALQQDQVYNAYDALRDVSADVFAHQVKHVVSRRTYGLCLLVVDATDSEHSALKHVRRLIGKTPCWLVLTKIDLLPRCHTGDVRALTKRIGSITGTMFLHTLAVSAATGHGMIALAERLLASLGGKDVFCIGAANVGKSTLVQSLAQTIASARLYYQERKASHAHHRRHVLQHDLSLSASHLPGTTLQAVRVPCFGSPRHALWDTPGILQPKSLSYALFPSHVMEPLCRPQRIPLPSTERGTQGQWRLGYSLLVQAAWMDVNSGTTTTTTSSSSSAAAVAAAPCVLARIDLVDIGPPIEYSTTSALSSSVFVNCYLHPSLRVRLVLTHLAPDHATVPPEYIQHVEKLLQQGSGMNSDNNGLEESYSRPLVPHLTEPTMPNGRVTPTSKERNPHSGHYYMDLVFASLGWISISHRDVFTVIPHCVQGSVFSRRPALYPTNLARVLASHEEMAATDEAGVYDAYRDADDEYSQQDIEQGRHLASQGKGRGQRGRLYRGGRPGADDDDDLVPFSHSFNEDEWF